MTYDQWVVKTCVSACNFWVHVGHWVDNLQSISLMTWVDDIQYMSLKTWVDDLWSMSLMTWADDL